MGLKNNEQIVLTKSTYVQGLNCLKQVWLYYNDKDKLPKISDSLMHRFEEGRMIGELAKSLHPKGIDLSKIMNRDEVLSESLKKIKEGKPLFEAGFLFNNCYSRADILVPVDDDEWDIYEVKSGTSVKEDNFHDVSFQKYCYVGAGLKIRKCFVLHINSQYVRQGSIDPMELFHAHEVTDKVDKLLEKIEGKIKSIIEIIKCQDCPEITQEYYCEDPYGCHKDDQFWKDHPECNVFDLYRTKKKAVDLFSQGILCLKDIPETVKLNGKQDIQVECDKTSKTHIDKDKIREYLDELKYPLYYLDFETYATAVPLYDNLRPYQRIPFQFSLHIVEKAGDKPTHFSFLADGKEDPREEFISTLKSQLGDHGSVIVFNNSFELGVLKELSELFPEYSKWVQSIKERVWDLLAPFQAFCYYNPAQKGSASIKKVLPAVTGKSYSELDIGDGDTASRMYLYVIHKDEGNRKKVFKDLEKYCCLDTEGMIWILNELTKITN